MLKDLKVFFIAGLLLLSPVLGHSREKRVKMADLPPAVQKTVKEQSKGATLRGLSKEVEKGKTIYEVELIVNGHNRDLAVDENGKVIEVEEVVPLESIPASAKASIEKAAARGKILKVESVTHGDSIVAYEAIMQSDGKKSEVRVDPKGNPAPEE